MKPLRILIVDDSTLLRKILKDVLSPLSEVEVVGMVSNGSDALSRVALLKPDLVTLDVEMPGMNGIEVLAELQKDKFPGAVVMVSSHTERGAPMTIKALELGAFDFVLKPSLSSIGDNIIALREKLRPIVQTIIHRQKLNHLLRGGSPRVRLASGSSSPETSSAPPPVSERDKAATFAPQIVTIGVSTGGPKALAQIIPKLSREFTVPVVLVQHMPQGFTAEFAKSLHAKSMITVKEAEDGEPLQAGTVYVAQGGKHMKVSQAAAGKIINITDDPAQNSCKPSVDYCFRSVAELYGGNCLAVVLTGMGKDGAEGAQCIKRRGGKVIVQDEDTSVVFGMPSAVIEIGAFDMICPIHNIADEICRKLKGE